MYLYILHVFIYTAYILHVKTYHEAGLGLSVVHSHNMHNSGTPDESFTDFCPLL